MKRRITVVLLIAMLFLQTLNTRAQEKKRTLLVPAYPGSVAEPYGPPEKFDYPFVPIESRMQVEEIVL